MYVLCTLAVLTLHSLLRKRVDGGPDRTSQDRQEDGGEEEKFSSSRRRVQVSRSRTGTDPNDFRVLVLLRLTCVF